VAYASNSQWDRAITEYQTALRLKPDYSEAHNNLGIAYESRGQFDKAIIEYQSKRLINPTAAAQHRTRSCPGVAA